MTIIALVVGILDSSSYFWLLPKHFKNKMLFFLTLWCYIITTLLWWYNITTPMWCYSCDVILIKNIFVMLFRFFLCDVKFCDDVIHPPVVEPRSMAAWIITSHVKLQLKLRDPKTGILCPGANLKKHWPRKDIISSWKSPTQIAVNVIQKKNSCLT